MHSLNICKQEEHLYQLRPEDNEIPFMTAMYSLEPTITKLYWNGFVFDSLEAYGLALLSELKKEKPNEDLINSATVMLQNGVLKNYIRLTNVENKELYLEFISKNNELLQVKALSPVEQAIYLLNGLANKKSFMIEGKYFENVQSYSSFLAELYKDNLLDYKNYFGRNINEITAIKEFIKGDGAKQLDYYKKQADDIVCIKEQAFENVQSFIAFLAKLYEDNLFEYKKYFESNYCKIVTQKSLVADDYAKQIDYYFALNENLIVIENKSYKTLDCLISYLKEFSEKEIMLFLQNNENIISKLSKEKIVSICKELRVATCGVITADIGEYIKFGNYWQSNDQIKEPIEWQVLAKVNGKALLISKYGLDCKKYNELNENITWEYCSLRNWLNDEFINEAFSNNEQQAIALVTNENRKKTEFMVYDGRKTYDKIFLLSIDEVARYLKTVEDRLCTPTLYTRKHKVWRNKNNTCYWWLRSPGVDDSNAAGVDSEGTVLVGGGSVDDASDAVRPAMWVNLEY